MLKPKEAEYFPNHFPGDQNHINSLHYASRLREQQQGEEGRFIKCWFIKQTDASFTNMSLMAQKINVMTQENK